MLAGNEWLNVVNEVGNGFAGLEAARQKNTPMLSF
jgi:hypothetical protein